MNRLTKGTAAVGALHIDKAAAIASVTQTSVAAGAIAASANDADGAKLADTQALRAQLNAAITDIARLTTALNALLGTVKA